MHRISDELLHELRKQYPKGMRVKLIKMNDPYSTKLAPGCQGTVLCVDDVGTIHVQWDCGSRLGVVYGEDLCEPLMDQ